MCMFRLLFEHLFVAMHRAVLRCPLGRVCHRTAVTNHEVVANDDANVVEFEPLTGVDTTDLFS